MSTSSNITDSILKILDSIFNISFIILPCVGYIHQYFKIKRLGTSQGFSKLLSLILLVAFILRIFFWVGKRFDNVILYQCIAGIIMQIILLHSCVEYSPENKNNIKKANSIYFSLKSFWDWPYFEDFFFSILFFIIFVSSCSIMIGFENNFYMEFIGTMSAIVEAFLGVPQIVEICKTKKVNTISYVMILGWLIGDLVKFLFYVKSNSPIQLVLTAVAQFSFDIVIIVQIFYYSRMKIQTNGVQSNEIKYDNLKEEKRIM